MTSVCRCRRGKQESNSQRNRHLIIHVFNSSSRSCYQLCRYSGAVSAPRHQANQSSPRSHQIHNLLCHHVSLVHDHMTQRREPTKAEVAVVVANALGEVDVAVDELALDVAEAGAEDGDAVVALEGEGDLLGAPGEVTGTPLKVAWRRDGSAFVLDRQRRRDEPSLLPRTVLRSSSASTASPEPLWRTARRMWPSSTRMCSAEAWKDMVCVCVWMRCDGDGSGE